MDSENARGGETQVTDNPAPSKIRTVPSVGKRGGRE